MLRNYLASISFLSLITSCVGDVPPGGGGSGSDGDNTGGGGGGGGGGGDSLSVAEYAAQLGMKECDDAFACRANFPTDQGVTFDQAFGATPDACYMGAAQYYDATAIEAAISGGTIAYDGAAAKACIAGLGAPTCATYWTEGPDLPAACDTALVGKVADGAACTIDFECSNVMSFCDETSQKCTVDTGTSQRRDSTSPTIAPRRMPVIALAPISSK